MATETTLILVKPDGAQPRALRRTIVSRLERRGYELRGARLLKVTRALAQSHYAEHKGKPFFGDLVTFITSGPVLALAVRGENAIAGVCHDGATESRRLRPGTIRATSRRSSSGEHRPRLGLEGECQARAVALLRGRPDLSRPQGRDPGDQAFSSLSEISDDARRNREDWTKANAEYTDARARSNWAAEEIT
jgi:nucleoside-diphosphate kinase